MKQCSSQKDIEINWLIWLFFTCSALLVCLNDNSKRQPFQTTPSWKHCWNPLAQSQPLTTVRLILRPLKQTAINFSYHHTFSYTGTCALIHGELPVMIKLRALSDSQQCWKTRRWKIPPWLCIPCHHSSALHTNDVMFLLGHRGFRQNGVGCLATGYRKKIIKFLWGLFSHMIYIWELVAWNHIDWDPQMN